MSKRERIVEKPKRVYSTYDERIGKVASQLFRKEQLMYAEQRKQAKVKTWEKLQALMKERLPIHLQQELVCCS